MKIILASGSPRRKELLTQIGLEYEVIISDVVEETTSNIPDEVVKELSELKASDVFAKTSGDVLVIGADTVVAANGRILGKPVDSQDAFNMLKSLSGKNHSVYTGVTLCVRRDFKEEKITFAEETKVYVDDMTDEEIWEYVNTGDCLDKAGSYGIQGRFAAYITGICGDYNNVVGLPVGKLCQVLRNKRILIGE